RFGVARISWGRGAAGRKLKRNVLQIVGRGRRTESARRDANRENQKGKIEPSFHARTPCERTGGGILLVDLSLFQFAGDRIDLDGGLEVAGKIHLVFVEGPASEANQQLHARQPDRARENLRR